MTFPEITITGLTNQQNYNIDVFSLSPSGLGNRAPNYVQISPVSTGKSSHTSTPYLGASPGTPTNITSISNNTSGSISWQAPNDTDILGYLVWFYDTTYHLFTVLNNDITTLNINSLTNGTTYHFAISLYNLNGISEISQTVAITPRSQSVPCLVEGTLVLTSNGYTPVELLDKDNDYIITADGRLVSFCLLAFTIDKTDEKTAPFRIKAHAFGKNFPTEDMVLSPLHAFRISNKKNIWQIPRFATKINRGVIQERIGVSCNYYHVMLPNYFMDNLVINNGNIVESFCGNRKNYNLYDIYKFNATLGGFTRKISSIYNITH